MLKWESDLLAIISTHTLTWSVTFAPKSFQSTSLISTHTLTWSVTHYAPNSADSRNHFNSHAHVERDPRRLEGAD